MTWRITIPGQPVGKGSVRLTRGGVAYLPKPTRAWMDNAVALMALQSLPDIPRGHPIALTVDAVLRRPRRLYGQMHPSGRIPAPVKPDWDNIGKAVGDSLTASGIIEDDRLIVDGRVRTWYGDRDEDPAIYIELESA